MSKREQISQRMLDFAVAVITLIEKLPKTVVGKHIKEQLVRSGTSAGSNYEEACGAESKNDFKHKLSITLKELKESRFWLRIIKRTKLLHSEQIETILKECEELCAIIGKSVITSKKQKT
jgi:four helix bundle protein